LLIAEVRTPNEEWGGCCQVRCNLGGRAIVELGIGPHQRGPAPPLPVQIFFCPVRTVRPSRDCALSLDFMAPRLHGLRAVPPRASVDRGRQGPRRRSRVRRVRRVHSMEDSPRCRQVQGHGSGTFCHLQTSSAVFAAQTALRPELDRAVAVTSYPPVFSVDPGLFAAFAAFAFTLPAPFFFPSSFLCACFQYSNISISHNIPTTRKACRPETAIDGVAKTPKTDETWNHGAVAGPRNHKRR
jgi:hypothetical protein